MKIYIDESGIFTNPNNKPHTVSCIAGLIIPENMEKEIYSGFKKLTSSWDTSANEIKGSRLNENQVGLIIQFLRNYKVVFEVCAIDLGFHYNADIEQHKLIQGNNLVENLTSDHHPKLLNQLNELKTKIINMPNQLYTQFISLTELVNTILRSTMLYYCHSLPEALQEVKWIIDAKGNKKTEYENLWSILAMGFLQTIFLNNPIKLLDDINYNCLEKYLVKNSELSSHLKKHAKKDINRSFQFDLKKMLTENLNFMDSKKSTGLQLVDILVNAIRRAFNNNMNISGWENIGCLMLKKFKGEHSIKMITLRPNSKIVILSSTLPYYKVLKEVDKKSKTALPIRK